MIIAFSGNDGSGKSTVASTFKLLMRNCGISVEYREEFKYFLLKYILSMFKSSYIERERQKFVKGFRNNICLPKYRVWVWAVLLDSNVEYMYLKLAKRNKLIILDRCLLDHLASFDYLGCIGNLSRKFFLRTAKLDLVVVLDAPPEIMFKRKKFTHSHPAEFYYVQRDRYLRIARALKLPIINTNRPINNTLRDILRVTAKKITSKIEDLVLHILSDPYDDADKGLLNDIEFKTLDFRYLLIEASKNNVEFQVYKNLLNYNIPKSWKSFIKKILRIFGNRRKHIVNTLVDIINIFERYNVEYVIFKTLPPFRTLPRDIDIVVKSRESAIKALRKIGFRIIRRHVIHNEVDLEKKGVRVDLHWDIGWMGRRIIDKAKLFEHSHMIWVDGAYVRVPKTVYEFLLVLAHSVLQHHYLTLGDLHYIRSLLKSADIDWNHIIGMTSFGDWIQGFKTALGIVKIKDLLFYQGKLYNAVPSVGSINPSFAELGRPVTWIPWNAIPSNGFLGFADKLLDIPRRIRWKISGKLPYNQQERILSKVFRFSK